MRVKTAALLCLHLLECGSASASRVASLCRHPWCGSALLAALLRRRSVVKL
jgi:hypothetical protein